MSQKLTVKIRRQDSPGAQSYQQLFEVLSPQKSLTVIAILRIINSNPMTTAGQRVSPVVFECHESDGHCGSCAMVINKKVSLACKTVITDFSRPLLLEPLGKFPLVKDLLVDSTYRFADFERLKSWREADWDKLLSAKVAFTQASQTRVAAEVDCTLCGACLEACPRFNDRSSFVGPALLVQAFKNGAGNSKLDKERFAELMKAGGLDDCGFAENCTKVCPENLPVSGMISALNKNTSSYFLKNLI